MSLSSDVDAILGQLTRGRRDEIAYYLASIVDSCDDAILTIDLDGTITSWNKAAERLYGYTVEEAVGKPITMLTPSDRYDEGPAILERIKRGERVKHYDTLLQRRHGSLINVSLTVSPVRNAEGKIIGASKVSHGITERKRAQDRQQFLVRELEHRAKNLFAVIQSIVSRTLIEGQTLAGAKEVLIGRLNALAQAHSLLAEAAWQGAPLAEIIQRQFAAFSKRFNLSSCDIVLNTPATQQFALVIHEPATNAMKYGALSVPKGRVSIDCNVRRAKGDGTLTFSWKELGGPTVSAPKRKGFGSTILLDGAKPFGAKVSLNYEPKGLRYELRFPLSAVEAANKTLGLPLYALADEIIE
jgi:PAS domain S-box-containing protein